MKNTFEFIFGKSAFPLNEIDGDKVDYEYQLLKDKKAMEEIEEWEEDHTECSGCAECEGD